MPSIASFISYRPGRGKQQKTPIKVSSPFPVNNYNSTLSPHPYASPRIIDINDGRVQAASPNAPVPSPYYNYTNSSTPRVQLNVNLDPEPLTDWFPTEFLRTEPVRVTVAAETNGASGSGTYYSAGYNVRRNVGTPEDVSENASVESEEADEEDSLSDGSNEEALAKLQEMEASNFVAELGTTLQFDSPSSHTKKSAPTPIKIPNAAFNGPKVQVIRSSDLSSFSRPLSQVSSPESSAVSGTTLARALLANTFVLSGETRASRYRSGGSNLTRTDSATLPRGEWSFMHSPGYRDRLSLEVALSPGVPPNDPVPPIPGNAELVYVPPQTVREPRRQGSSPATEKSERESEAASSPQNDDSKAQRRMSRIPEASFSQDNSPQLAYVLPEMVVNGRPRSPLRVPSPPPILPPPPPAPPSDLRKSRRYSMRPESGIMYDGILSPPLPDPPMSAKDYDNVLDYYSFADDTPDPTVERNFRPPFSPITEVTEESSSQLTPPAPYRSESRGSKRSLPPGRFFLGTTPSASISGVRVDWNVRNSTTLGLGRRDSTTKMLPFAGNMSSASSSSTTRPPIPSSSSSSEINKSNLLAPSSNVFNRLRAGSAPSPIKVERDSRDLSKYQITVTPRTSGSTVSTPTTGDSDGIQQTFPETPSAFSPGFSPNSSMMSPGMRGSSIINDYLSMAVPQTPMSAFLPAASQAIQPSLAQQVLLTRAATSVHGNRHSRQASLTRLMRQQGYPTGRPASIAMGTSSDEGTSAVEMPVAGSSGIVGESSMESLFEEDTDAVVKVEEVAAPPEVKIPPPPPIPTHLTPPESSKDKPLPASPQPSPQPTLTPIGHSPPEPTAPVLGTVNLPQMTPSPLRQPLPEPRTPAPAPLTPRTPGSTHDSEYDDEVVLAYDIQSAENSPALPPALPDGPRPPSRAGSKRSIASAESPSIPQSTVVGPPAKRATARIPPPPTKAPPVPPMMPPTPPTPPTPPHAPIPPVNPPSLGRSNDGPSSTSISSVSVAPLTPLSARRPAESSPRTRTAESSSSNNTPIPPPPPILPPLTNTGSPIVTTSHSPLIPRRPEMIHPPPPQLQLPPAGESPSSLYSLSYDAGLSPPSYYAAINSDRDRVAGSDAYGSPLNSGASYDPNFRFGTSPYQPIPPSPAMGNSPEFQASGSTVQRNGQQTQSVIGPRQPKPRTRPPLPAGPRRPSHAANAVPFPSVAAMQRERGGSVSSVASQMPSGSGSSGGCRRVAVPAPLPSPRFQAPAPKFRGYTMDAAKWMFTSTQLQAIVSRAIRQSSEPSSIRLLQLETLENEIPAEMNRLEALRGEAKMRYKTLVRKRGGLLDSLVGSVEGGAEQDALRIVEELRDVSGTLDRVTEELYSLDEQVSQLGQLCQAHSTSALAMALRKLNGSFLKQFAEAQTLRQQVEALEAERDEAWNQAAEVANDYEDLRSGKTVESPEAESRFDRVMAVRKSSIRAAKAGLRNTSVRSNQRASSVSSVRGGGNTPSSARTTQYSIDEPPPVPPIPRRRPVDIMTNIPLRASTVTGPSTDGPTPTSETRALARAQDELYDMLGIPNNDRSRRSRSVIGVPGEDQLQQQVVSPSYINYDVPPNTGRRASLPPSAQLPPDIYNNFTADVSIILTSDRAGWI